MGVKIESIGLCKNTDRAVGCSIELIREAASDCIKKSCYRKEEINLLINTSLYRDNWFGEPAFATFVQNDLGMNNEIRTISDPKTFAFDLMCGAMGFFKACQISRSMISANKARTALIVSGDVLDISVDIRGADSGFRPMGAAMLLDSTNNNGIGFGTFYFKNFPEHQDAYVSSLLFENQTFTMLFRKAPDIENIYLKVIASTVSDFLERERLSLNDFDLVFPPQISPKFVSELDDLIGKGETSFVNAARDDGDSFNASLPLALEYAFENKMISPGTKALFIGVGSGIQAGCAAYKF